MSNLWEQYKKNDDMHIHNTSDTVFNAFGDALTIQGERILKNVMKSLKISRKRAQKICFCEIEEEECQTMKRNLLFSVILRKKRFSKELKITGRKNKMGKNRMWSEKGYQPTSTVTGVPVLPNAGSNVKKEDIKVILNVVKKLNAENKKCKEIIKRTVVENFCCNDCKEVGLFDECQKKEKSCEQIVSDWFDEVME